MKLVRYGLPGHERPGVIGADGQIIDVSAFTRDFGEEFFGGPWIARLRERLGEAGRLVSGQPRLGPPIARPSKLVCVGLNYADHARESNLPAPSEPVLFMKATSAICGPFDPIWLPPGSERTDWEVELAVVIGQRACDIPESVAKDHIAGYMIHNDVSERAYQLERGGQWVKGKSCDHFAPLGPWLVTPDEISDPGQLSLWLKVNGQTMQRGNTQNLIFPVTHIVSYVSRFMTLLPGDVISTGTPAGVGLGRTPPVYLRAGDVVELGIDGLGEARQRVEPRPYS